MEPQRFAAEFDAVSGRLDVESKKIDWLWKPRIARGKLTLVVGMPDVSKSTLTLDLASRITTFIAEHAPSEVRAAADLLGHPNHTTTERHYIHARSVAAGRKLEGAINAARGRLLRLSATRR